MSFDTVLNYAPCITGITNIVTNLQATNIENASKLAVIQSTPYANLVTSEINRLNKLISNNTNIISNYQNILFEINQVQNLPQNDKSLIYYFYTVLGVPKPTFMIKLLFNSNAINNPNVLAIYNDSSITPEAKLLLAKLIYDQFSMNNQYKELSTIGTLIV